MRRSRRNRSGFTLLELMIVICIIGILAAILIPNFIRSKYRAHLASCQSNERTIVTAAEIYRNDHDAYPPAGIINPGNPLYINLFINGDAVRCPSNDSFYTLDTMGDSFTLSCNGIHHLVLPVSAGYPQFSNGQGQILNP